MPHVVVGHRCMGAENCVQCVCVFVSVVVVGGKEAGPWDAHTRRSSRSPEPCVQANAIFQTMCFPKIQHCAPPPQHHHHPNTHPERSSLHKHSVKARRDSAADPPCALLAVTLTCFCGFYRQLQTTLSHIATTTSMNTDPLCHHGGAWEEPSATQHRDHPSVCVLIRSIFCTGTWRVRMQLVLVCSYYAGFAEMMQESDTFPLSHPVPCYYVQLVPQLEQIGAKTNTHKAQKKSREDRHKHHYYNHTAFFFGHSGIQTVSELFKLGHVRLRTSGGIL